MLNGERARSAAADSLNSFSDRDPAAAGSMQANGEAAVATAGGGDYTVPVSADTRGKHRILAELKRWEQEARFLEVFFHFFPPRFSKIRTSFFFFFYCVDLFDVVFMLT